MWIDTFGGPDEEIVFYVFCGVSGLIVLLSVINLILGCTLSKHSVSISCDFHLEIGCLCLVFSVLARGFNAAWAESQAIEIVCKIYHVILLIGLTQFIGGLFVKGWTLFLFYKYNNDKRPLSEEWIPNLLIWLLIVIIAAASLVWVFLFTPQLDGLQCVSPNEFEWKVGTSAWHGLLLLLALIAVPANCCVTRGTPGSREAAILSIVTLNTILAVAAGIALHYTYEFPSDTIEYAIIGGLTLWMCLFADFMFLISKCCSSCSKDMDDHGDNYDTINAGSNRHSMVQNNPSFDDTLTNGKTNDTFEY